MKTNRARVFFGGLFAALSLSAAPAFADHGQAGIEAGVRIEIRGPKFDSLREKREMKVRYEEKLEARVLELVNAQRARYGLPAMSANLRGTKAARMAALEASREGSFRSLDSTAEARLRDQGIRADYEMAETTSTVKESNVEAEAKKIVKAWFKNPKQARMLLDEDLTYAGVGAVSANGKVSVALDAFGPKKAKPVVSKPPKTNC